MKHIKKCYVVSNIKEMNRCIRCRNDLEGTLKYGKRCPICDVYYVSSQIYSKTSNMGVFKKIGSFGHSERGKITRAKTTIKDKSLSNDNYNSPRNVKIREELIASGVLKPFTSEGKSIERSGGVAKISRPILQKADTETITAHDFVVRINVLQCRHKNHHVEDIQAVITTINRQGTVSRLTIPAGYCPDCHTYFIMDNVFQRIKRSGVPICRTMDEKTYTSATNNLENNTSQFAHLAQESVLKQFGYNVNQGEDLPAAQRRNILAAIVDYNVLTKNEVISYLNYFINNRKAQKNRDGSLKFAIAIERWKGDIDWISSYKLGSFKKVAVEKIVANK